MDLRRYGRLVPLHRSGQFGKFTYHLYDCPLIASILGVFVVIQREVSYDRFEGTTLRKAYEWGPTFMALLTVSTASALTEAGNVVLTASVSPGLAANFCSGACVLYVTNNRHSTLTRLAQIRRLHVSGEFGSNSRAMKLGPEPDPSIQKWKRIQRCNSRLVPLTYKVPMTL